MSQTRMEFAYTQLRDKVWSGDLKPGDRLVNRTLGEELGVSTVTVREAIHRLASDGVVEHVPNAGAYVRNLSAQEMVDLFSLRAWLDLFTVREAVRKIEDHELRRLRSINGQMRDTIVALRKLPKRVLRGEAMDQWLELDRRFHSLLCDAAHNSWLIKATNDIHLLSHVMRAKASVSGFADAAWTYRQHAEITRALEKRDVKRASEWMRIHGEQALATMLVALEAQGRPFKGPADGGGEELEKRIAKRRLIKPIPTADDDSGQ